MEMDKNEIMTSEEVIEAAEEITSTGAGKALKVAAGIGLAVLVGGIAYRYIVKPVMARVKGKKAQSEMVIEMPNCAEESDIMEESEE